MKKFDYLISEEPEKKEYKPKKQAVVFEQLIIAETDDYLVINKPPHISSTEERTADKSVNIKTMAQAYADDPQLCHRLDKETSGVLLIAKNPVAYRHFSLQFEHREVRKCYHAVVNGVHGFDGTSINLPIEKMGNGTSVRIDREKGKSAETVFYTLKAYRYHSLIECMPITGRMHQIRIHLACLKAPIVADETYGGDDIFLSRLKKKFNLKKDTEEEPLIKRVALHAFSLSFKDLSGQDVTIEAPYPKDFNILTNKLEKFG